MGLTKCKIGSFIEAYSRRCAIPDLRPEQVSGINIEKEFFEPAKQVGEDTSNYKVVPPNSFACNLMHVGRDNSLPIALNHSANDKFVSPAYSVFKLKDDALVLKEYFYILLKSTEKDRFFSFHTDSSIRQGLPWEDFCDIEIILPDIETQRKYVNVYLSLQNNLATYQSKIEELKLVCDGYIEDLKKSYHLERLGKHIIESDDRNWDLRLGIEDVVGVSINKDFINTKADMAGVPLGNYKVIKPGMFVFNVNTARMGDKFAIALCDDGEHIVSSIYGVFYTKDELLPEFLMLYFKRPEFDRYVRFNSWGSAREVFTMEDMKDVAIPLPNLHTQKEIVNIYKSYVERQRIATKLKEQLNNLCPILVKGSLQSNN